MILLYENIAEMCVSLFPHLKKDTGIIIALRNSWNLISTCGPKTLSSGFSVWSYYGGFDNIKETLSENAKEYSDQYLLHFFVVLKVIGSVIDCKGQIE